MNSLDPHTAAALAHATPRHLDLAKVLIQNIQGGQPAVGELLPTEAELCSQWGLSRYAVRQAVQKLTDLGMVSRQAGVGTKVVANRPQTRYTQAMDALTDLARYAKGTVLRNVTTRQITASEDHSTLLRTQPGSKWLQISGVRYDSSKDSAPIALVHIFVDADFGQITGLSKKMDVPVYKLIEDKYGIKITHVEQELSSVLIEEDYAQRLNVAPGSPGMQIVRTYFVRDKVVEVTTGLHPADRFRYSMTFQLESNGR